MFLSKVLSSKHQLYFERRLLLSRAADELSAAFAAPVAALLHSSAVLGGKALGGHPGCPLPSPKPHAPGCDAVADCQGARARPTLQFRIPAAQRLGLAMGRSANSCCSLQQSCSAVPRGLRAPCFLQHVIGAAGGGTQSPRCPRLRAAGMSRAAPHRSNLG